MAAACLSDFVEPGNSETDLIDRWVLDVNGIASRHDMLRMINIRPGLVLSICELCCNFLPPMQFEIRNAPVSLSCCISGACAYHIKGFQGKKDMVMALDSGMNLIGALPNVSGEMTFNPCKPTMIVDLKIDRPLLHHYIKDRLDRLPKEMFSLFEPESQIISISSLGRDMARTVMEIIHPPALTGQCLMLFYESRALELLALHIEKMTQTIVPEDVFKMTPADKDRIHAARQILLNNIQDPPTIATLARQCGINEFKLKKGFKQVFNTTIFKFVTMEKMDRAWALLAHQNFSVTHAASEVGYTNVSHFITAFRKRFNINPGDLKRTRTLSC